MVNVFKMVVVGGHDLADGYDEILTYVTDAPVIHS